MVQVKYRKNYSCARQKGLSESIFIVLLISRHGTGKKWVVSLTVALFYLRTLWREKDLLLVSVIQLEFYVCPAGSMVATSIVLVYMIILYFKVCSVFINMCIQ
jgi:hypothetical protein